MSKILYWPFLLLLILASTSVLRAEEKSLEQQKAESGEFVGENLKAKDKKASDKTVGGNYQYGRKEEPKYTKPEPKHSLSAPKVATKAKKDPKKDEKPISGSDVLTLFGILTGAALVIPIAGALYKEGGEAAVIQAATQLSERPAPKAKQQPQGPSTTK